MGVKRNNAEFHAFKKTGKWYNSEKGYLSRDVFGASMTIKERRAQIVKDNDGTYPGLSTDGEEFIFVVISEDHFPLMLMPDD